MPHHLPTTDFYINGYLPASSHPPTGPPANGSPPTQPSPGETTQDRPLTEPPARPAAGGSARNRTHSRLRQPSDRARPRSTLRIAYVGPNMDLAQLAYTPEHDDHRHETMHVRSVADVRHLHPSPDVVVINPMVMTLEGIAGACALQAIVGQGTLIVAVYSSLGYSHSMYTRHAMAGHCHPRMLLHYPSPLLSAADIVARMDQMARGSGGGPTIATTGQLPEELTRGSTATDLGQLLAEDAANHRSEESLTYARLLHAAAVDPTWATWQDLANRLGFAEGHVKNTKAKLGRDIRSRVLPGDHQGVGVPVDRQKAWRIVEFTRFVTEHRSFIRAYCEHHLLLEDRDVRITRKAG